MAARADTSRVGSSGVLHSCRLFVAQAAAVEYAVAQQAAAYAAALSSTPPLFVTGSDLSKPATAPGSAVGPRLCTPCLSRCPCTHLPALFF